MLHRMHQGHGGGRDHLYVIGNRLARCVKVGRSNDPKRRLQRLQTANHNPLELLAVFRGWGFAEPDVHRALPGRLEGEWFAWGPEVNDLIRPPRPLTREEPMVCRACGCAHLHVEGVGFENAGKQGGDFTRQAMAVVRFRCECGARSEARIGNHKGDSLVRWALVEEPRVTPDARPLEPEEMAEMASKLLAKLRGR